MNQLELRGQLKKTILSSWSYFLEGAPACVIYIDFKQSFRNFNTFWNFMRFSWQFILKEILKNFQNICRNASEEDLDLSAISPAILEHLWFPDVEIRHFSSSPKDKQTNGKDNWTERQILFIYKPALFGHLFCGSLKLPTGSPTLELGPILKTFAPHQYLKLNSYPQN